MIDIFSLGDKVKFSRFVKRTGNLGIDSDTKLLTDEECEKLTHGDITIQFRGAYDCKPSTGIVVGKRKNVFKTRFFLFENYIEMDDDVYSDTRVERENFYETVYLVACDLRGFKRVLPRDLELVKGSD